MSRLSKKKDGKERRKNKGGACLAHHIRYINNIHSLPVAPTVSTLPILVKDPLAAFCGTKNAHTSVAPREPIHHSQGKFRG